MLQKTRDALLREWRSFLKKSFCVVFFLDNYLPPVLGALTMMPVNKAGLGQQEAVESTIKKYLGLLRKTSKIIGAITG